MDKEVPEYARRLKLASDRNPDLFPKGEVSHPLIRHDNWCRLLVQGGTCDCSPDVEVAANEKRYRVLPSGALKAL
jgi:hypothetical protein